MMPVVSIIMPLYNGASTVQESVDSACLQSFKDWELIIIDDLSSDNSLQIAEEAAKKDSRIRVYQSEAKKNLGPSAVRNRGFNYSKGKFIAFLDADDVWLKDKLQIQMDIADKHPACGMIWGPAEYFYTEGEIYLQPTEMGNSSLWDPPVLVKNFLSNLRGTPCPSGVLMRRDVFEKIGGFDENLRRGEDIALFIKTAAEYQVYYCESVLFRYRRHLGSAATRADVSGTRFREELLFHEWSFRYLSSKAELHVFLNIAENNYHSVLRRMVSDQNWLQSRKFIFRKLSRLPGLCLKRYGRFLLDVLFPFYLSKKIAAKIFKPC